MVEGPSGHRSQDVMRQIYIDPIYIRGNILRAYLWWDWNTRVELRVEFPDGRRVVMDRFKIIGFILELMRRSGIETVISKNDFINMHFSEFNGLNIKVINIDF